MERGHKVPGYKLVRRTTHRKWVDSDTLDANINALGVPLEHMYTQPKLISPAAVETILKGQKKMSAADIAKAVNALAIRPAIGRKAAYRGIEMRIESVARKAANLIEQTALLLAVAGKVIALHGLRGVEFLLEASGMPAPPVRWPS
jgi:hypothetical protein